MFSELVSLAPVTPADIDLMVSQGKLGEGISKNWNLLRMEHLEPLCLPANHSFWPAPAPTSMRTLYHDIEHPHEGEEQRRPL